MGDLNGSPESPPVSLASKFLTHFYLHQIDPFMSLSQLDRSDPEAFNCEIKIAIKTDKPGRLREGLEDLLTSENF